MNKSNRRACFYNLIQNMKKSILIINSKKEEIEEIQKGVANANTEVYIADNMQSALMLFVKHDFCLIVLDACMSEEDDHKLLKSMRAAKSTPIMVLSSKTDHSNRIHALQAGAHAYMGKPYTQEECMAQAHSLMKMYSDIAPEGNICYTLAFGNDLVIDPSTRQVFIHGKELKFTRKEFDLLFRLASNPGKVFTREQLYDQLWDEQSVYNVDDVVKHHIKTLRKKLTSSNVEYIKNVWGVGYRFEHDTEKDGR